MTLIHLIDFLTAAASLGVKFIGLPAQVKANQAAKRSGLPAGLVLKAAVAMCASYCLWVIHGLAVHDWVEVISQGAGFVITGILTAQAVTCDRKAKRLASDDGHAVT